MNKFYLLMLLVISAMNSCITENRSSEGMYEGLHEKTLAEKKISDLGFEVRFIELSEVNNEKLDISLLLKIKDLNNSGSPLKYKLSGEAEYGERITYFSFGVQSDLKLVIQGDTISCAVHHFVRKYDLAPDLDIVAVFPVNSATLQTGKPINGAFIYNDRIFNTGPVRMGLTFPPFKPKKG